MAPRAPDAGSPEEGQGCGRRGGLPAVEPALALATLALGLQGPLCTQFLWERLAGNGTGTGSGAPGAQPSACGGNRTQRRPQEQELEGLVARWSLYLDLAGFLVGLFAATLLGPWSDRVGRRPALVLPALGLALQAGVSLGVIWARLPVAWLLAGRLLAGLSGDYNLLLAASFAYAADRSRGPWRTFRLALLEACLGLAGAGAGLLGGPWRRAQGYLAPFGLALAASLGAALYAGLLLRESVGQRRPARLLTLRHYARVARLYAAPARGWPWQKLALYSLAFFVVVCVHFGARGLLVLYELGSPLCWGPVLVGCGSAALYFSYLSSLAALRLLQPRVREAWLAQAGLLSNASGLLTIALAATTPVMFTGYGLLFLSMMVTPILRSKLSNLADETEQGALFAAVACLEGLCSLVATGVFNSLYPASLHFMKGFPFLLGALLLLLPAAIIGWVEIRDARPEYSHFSDAPDPSSEGGQVN